MTYQERFVSRWRKPIAVGCVLLASAVFVTGCDLARNHLKIDRSANYEFQDYRDALASRLPSEEEKQAQAGAGPDSEIPSLKPYVMEPSENLRAMPLVSISVNQTVPLRDALFELARQANYDIELDPRISGSVIFTARERPFDQVIDRLADMSGLRYKFDEDTLRVELDVPYNKSYKIDYLSYVRKNASSIKNTVSVASSGGGQGAGPSAGSEFTASGESEANFWGELETNLTQILGVATRNDLRTASDPQITAVDQNPAPVEPVVVEGQQTTDAAAAASVQPASGTPSNVSVQTSSAGASATSVTPPVDTAASTSPPPAGESESDVGGQSPAPVVQPPNAVLQVNSLPPVDSGVAGEVAESVTSSFAINKQAGLITVFATERQHKEIAEYLNLLRRAVTSQVLIEAKVMEVALTDEFSTGIDWSLVSIFDRDALAVGFDVVGAALNPPLDPVSNPDANFTAVHTSGDFNAALQAISRFGTVHALASPRLTVLNNQSAVLNVARNQVYFELDIDVTTEDGVTQTDVDSDIKSVPEGVLINVQPSIDLERSTISLAVRPTITRIVDLVDDPAVQFITAQNNIDGVVSQVPVVNVQELDSVVNMDSGQALVMGGLMQDRTDAEITGVPVLSEVPVFGSLFRTQTDEITKTELVIFLKATIIESGSGTVDNVDRDLYRLFSQDRRPLKL